jgi:hypothetical protein
VDRCCRWTGSACVPGLRARARDPVCASRVVARSARMRGWAVSRAEPDGAPSERAQSGQSFPCASGDHRPRYGYAESSQNRSTTDRLHDLYRRIAHARGAWPIRNSSTRGVARRASMGPAEGGPAGCYHGPAGRQLPAPRRGTRALSVFRAGQRRTSACCLRGPAGTAPLSLQVLMGSSTDDERREIVQVCSGAVGRRKRFGEEPQFLVEVVGCAAGMPGDGVAVADGQSEE